MVVIFCMNPNSQNLSDVACVQTPPPLKNRGESLFPPLFFGGEGVSVHMLIRCDAPLSTVYAASDSDLTPVQCFLDCCFERKYTSKPVTVYDILYREARSQKFQTLHGHPLLFIVSRVKPFSYHLRKETCQKPKL